MNVRGLRNGPPLHPCHSSGMLEIFLPFNSQDRVSSILGLNLQPLIGHGDVNENILNNDKKTTHIETNTLNDNE